MSHMAPALIERTDGFVLEHGTHGRRLLILDGFGRVACRAVGRIEDVAVTQQADLTAGRDLTASEGRWWRADGSGRRRVVLSACSPVSSGTFTPALSVGTVDAAGVVRGRGLC